jgi:hypothetical protein
LPGTPGEGQGEGSAISNPESEFPADPHPDPLPAYRERGSDAWSRRDFVLLVAVLAIAAVLRSAALDRSLPFDELWHLALSSGRGSPVGQIEPDRILFDPPKMTSLAGAPTFFRVWTHMDGVLHPPLYVVTLRIWRDVSGSSDAAAMSYSIAWSLVAVGFTFATVRLLSDRYAATLIALAMVAARTQMHFALAVRGYEMVIGLGAIALWIMVRIEVIGATRRHAVSLAAMTLPLLLTHYFAAGAVMAIAMYGLWRASGQRIAFVIALAACSLVYAAIWMPFALRQLDDVHTGDAFLRVDQFDAAVELLWIFGAPMRLIVDASPTTTLAGVVGIVGAILLSATALRRGRAAIVLPPALWLIGSLGLIAGLDATRLTRHAFFIRYLAIATPGAFVLVPAIGKVLGRWGAIVTSAAVLMLALAVRPAGPVVMEETPDYSATARWLAANASADEALLLYHGAAARDVGDMLFLHASHEPGLFPRPVVKVERPLSFETIGALPRRAWIVIPYPSDDSLAAIFRDPRILERVAMPEGGPGQIYHVEWPR